MVNEIHSGSLLKRAAIMLPQQFLEMLDRLRLESMQHPQQSMGKSKLFPGAAIAMLHYPQSAPCPSIPCAPFPKRGHKANVNGRDEQDERGKEDDDDYEGECQPGLNMNTETE